MVELSELEKDLLEAADEMLAHVRGEIECKTYHYYVPDKLDIKEIRDSLHLTQEQFATIIGASVHAVRHWENGRRQPEGTARTLLYILQKNPQSILDTIARPIASPQ